MNDQDSRGEALKELMADPAYAEAAEACRRLFDAEEEKDAEALWKVCEEGARRGPKRRAPGGAGRALRGAWLERDGIWRNRFGIPESAAI